MVRALESVQAVIKAYDVRGLVGELSSERDAMLNHAEQVRALLIGSHQRLSNDVEGASEHAAERIEAAAQSFTALLDDRTNEISRRYEDQGRQLADFFTEQSQSTQSALNATGEELARRIASTADEAGARLQQATEAVNRLIEERSGELERRAEELTRGATELSDRVHGAITSANERIAEALRVGSESWTVDNTLFLTSLEAMLAEKADRISAEEAGFTARITGSMEERLGVLNQEVDRFLSMIDDRFDEKMLRTSLLLEGKGEDILERFEQRLIHLEAVLDRHGQPLVETLGQHVGAIESSIERMDTSLAGGVERERREQTSGGQELQFRRAFLGSRERLPSEQRPPEFLRVRLRRRRLRSEVTGGRCVRGARSDPGAPEPPRPPRRRFFRPPSGSGGRYES